jgi:predicted DsbA family dithiol-disulfide isomerase
VSEAADSPKVLVFFDYACVFCYTEWFRLAHLAERYHAELTPVPFELRPDLPAEGVSAAAHGLAHSEHVDEYLHTLARRGGFPLVIPDLVPNTHRAMVLAEVARDAGAETHKRVHAAIFDAYFGRGLDIGSADVLLPIAEEHGLDPAEVRRAWDEGTFEPRLDEFHDFAHRLGVTMTPSALVCDELLIGTHPYRQLAEAAERCLQRAAQSS